MQIADNIYYILEISIYLIYGLIYIYGFVHTFFLNTDETKMKHLYRLIGIGIGMICMFLLIRESIEHNFPINNIGVFLSPFLTLVIAYFAWKAIKENVRVSKQGDNIKLLIDNDKLLLSSDEKTNIENIKQVYGINIKDEIGVTSTQFLNVVNSLRASSFYYTLDDGETKDLSPFRKAFFKQKDVRKIYGASKGKMFANSRMTSIIDKHLQETYPDDD